ncbi:MAG: nicotinate-nucleotide--dimethylbenzimidazole phosphoribosyltransferase [Capsulimonadaceae bacterium]|nr:nicotinate-nucleotide--dimethylbenzimidazole phosphoribosyltransferase [Capsulimonadaceae bacterium]
MTDYRKALTALVGSVGPLDEAAAKAAADRQLQLTKPTGSLGRLEELSVQLAGITGKAIPDIEPPVILVFAGDHGVASARGVSAYPPEVTAQMVLNYAAGGAVVCVLARQAGARVAAVDIGVMSELPQNGTYIHRRVKSGADDWTKGPAMSEEEALAALMAGADIVAEQATKGLGLLALGEMGIGNTATSSALLAALLGLAAEDVTGRGTGVDDAGYQRKIAAVKEGLALHADVVRSGDPVAILAALGGLEIAGMSGAMIAAASRRVPVIVDGFICSVSALIAVRICPAVREYLIPSHRSEECGQRLALEAIGLKPYFDMQMRLGEGSGAALAIPIVRSSVAVLRETATFAEASVSDR